MQASRIEARAVFKVVALALVAIAAALLLVLLVLHTRTTLRWLAAAIFLALALNPLVDLLGRPWLRGRRLPRWLAILAVYVLFAVAMAFLVLQVIPPMVREVEGLASTLPTYVTDAEHALDDSSAFRELNDKYNLTSTLLEQAKALPSHLGDAASEVSSVTVTVVTDLIAAVVVLTMTFFLLLDGRRMSAAAIGRLRPRHRERASRIATRVYDVVRGYVTVNLALAVVAGLFTWGVLELLGVDIAVPLAVLIVILDLIPLIGLTVGGLIVALAVAFHDFPTDLIIWIVLFLVYQQVQDRVVQPLLFGHRLQINPLMAIVAVLVGAQVAGILGALLAIPVAASIAVVIDELWPRSAGDSDEDAAPAAEQGGTAQAAPEPGSAG